ncbi:MAG: DNA adenine methylase [Endomicrobium sp.]|jgi:site-specific DNA-methyltransferase (adenine-specific)|nr:DNA adenine methylase [Endomicrobium sp.]
MKKYIDTVTAGDCIELLNRLPDNSVDMTFADPPFNLRKKYGRYNDHLKDQEYLNWCKMWILELVRVTKSTGSIFLHNIPKWLIKYSYFLDDAADFKHWIAWDAQTAPMGKTLQPSHYGILFYAKDAEKLVFNELRYPHKRSRQTNILAKDYGGKKHLLHPYGPLVSDVWTDIHRLKHNKYRDTHPCQLPVHLLERFILMATDENNIVLDPFVGTGTTAVAAKRLGRRYIGFDIDDNYVDITKNKLNNVESNSRIGSSWVSFYLGEIITLRDKDWNDIKQYFYIPTKKQDVDKQPIILKNKSKAVPNYCAVKNEIRDLSLFANAKNFKMTKKFIEKC